MCVNKLFLAYHNKKTTPDSLWKHLTVYMKTISAYVNRWAFCIIYKLVNVVYEITGYEDIICVGEKL